MVRRRILWTGLLLGLLTTGWAGGARHAAAAPARHPMGNFTINQYSSLRVQGDGVVLFYVVDMAEIPTYQELGEIRPDRSTALSAAERDAYLGRKVGEIIPNLALSVDGSLVALEQRGARLSFPPGAGGLPTLRIEFDLFAPLAGPASGELRYHDGNFAERIGWKEIVAQAGPGGQLSNSSVPATDRSNLLTSYPSDMINSPPQVVTAGFSFSTDGVSSAGPQGAAGPVAARPGDWISGRMDALTSYMTMRELPFGALLLALLVAFALGAAHALTPGHGKSVAAAYLVGSRGTALHAVLLGLSVTVTHTIGVFVLGLITMYAAQYILPEQLYPWISLISGLLVLLMGVTLFRGRWRGLLAGGVSPLPFLRPRGGMAGPATGRDQASLQPHVHEPGGHGDDGEHQHWPGGKPHSHLPAERGNVTIGGILALGASGGLLPCPSALILMLSAISFGQVGLGVILIIAFSLGLAVVLTAIGLLLLYARRFVERSPIRVDNGLLRRLPLVSALGVAGLGLIISVEALGATGLLR